MQSWAMEITPAASVLTIEQISEMHVVLSSMRVEAAAAMYRTDASERPYKAGRGEMYRHWNTLGHALKVLEVFKQVQYPECST